ncbi:MAG: LuxR C-terminal-related transcriptional regulator, partial [Salinisphaera sp.]|nr:LuxR C-terminal-related transcriptional regulator [Salinisphaera sp.]
NARAAVVRLRRLLADAEGHDRRLAATTLRLPLAQALDDLGQTQAAQAMLIQALEAGARMRLVRSFLDEGLLVLLEQLRDVVRRDAGAMPISEAAIRHLNRLIGTARAADKAAPSPPSANLSMHRVGALVEPLKERELQIIRLLGQGCSNKEIARNLGVGVDAVKWHLKNAYAKLCVSRRTQAVAEAKRLGLMD